MPSYPDPVPADPTALERSVLLALGLAARPVTPLDVRRTVHAVQGDDEPHDVVGLPGAADLAHLVAAWGAGAGPVEVAALLPAPGDASGLPPEVAAAAIDARECVLVHLGTSWAVVPDVVAFGSALETGYQVTWTVHPVEDWRTRLPGVVGTLGEAEQALRASLRTATQALVDLDVARWRPDAAAAIAALRASTDLGLPMGLDPRVVRVVGDAARLRTIVELATADDGAAVSLWQADQRTAALRDVERSARRAIAAATLAAGRAQPSTDR